MRTEISGDAPMNFASISGAHFNIYFAHELMAKRAAAEDADFRDKPI